MIAKFSILIMNYAYLCLFLKDSLKYTQVGLKNFNMYVEIELFLSIKAIKIVMILFFHLFLAHKMIFYAIS